MKFIISNTLILLAIMTVNVLIRPTEVSAFIFVAAVVAYSVQMIARTSLQENKFLEKCDALEKRMHELEKLEPFVSQRLAEAFKGIETLKDQQKTVTKLADDTKKLLSDQNLLNAFVPRAKRNPQ